MKRAFASLVILSFAAVAAAQTASAPVESAGTFSVDSRGAVRLLSQTQPSAMVSITAEVRGKLASIQATEGQTVKKNDVLVQLDDSLQAQEVALAKVKAESQTQIKAAQNQLEFDQNAYEKVKNNSAATETEKREKLLKVKQSELTLDLANEGQKEAQAKYQQEKLKLEQMTIRSPIDGQVLRINKQAGEQTDENPLIVVVQTSKLEAPFYPPKQMFGKIKAGDKVMLEMGTEPPTKKEGVVVTVDPIIDPASQLFRAKVEIDNSDRIIPAGTTATWTWMPK